HLHPHPFPTRRSSDLARWREAAARERDQERADPRTGVANLRAFYELAEAEIARARRYPHAFSVVYIDLDEFKLVNFRLGHEAGRSEEHTSELQSPDQL